MTVTITAVSASSAAQWSAAGKLIHQLVAVIADPFHDLLPLGFVHPEQQVVDPGGVTDQAQPVTRPYRLVSRRQWNHRGLHRPSDQVHQGHVSAIGHCVHRQREGLVPGGK